MHKKWLCQSAAEVRVTTSPPTLGVVDGDGCGEASASVAWPPWSTGQLICCASRRCDVFLVSLSKKNKHPAK